MSDKNNRDKIDVSAGYEKSDVSVKHISFAALGVAGFLVIIFLMLDALFFSVRDDIVSEVFLKPESKKLLELHAHEDSVLTNYKKLETGKYQIPIEEAMDLVVSEGKRPNK